MTKVKTASRAIPLVGRISGVATLLVAAPSLAGGAPYTEEAAARGVDFLTLQANFHGRGTAFADLDQDGDPDIAAVGGPGGAVGLFENDGTGWFTARTGALAPAPAAAGVIAGDYDSDGDLDLYVPIWGAANRLYRNDGDFMFTDVTDDAGVGHPGKATGCAWGDFDLDGRLDLYVANWDGPNLLYHNLGPGGFSEVATRLGVDAGTDPTFQATFVDYDRDGDADLYLATDRGMLCEQLGFQNHLFRNDGGVFVEVTEIAGAEACVDAMSIGVGDFDGNRWPDLYCTNTPSGNALLMNQGDGTFLELAEPAGVAVYETGWGAVFYDHDNDGRLDLYVCNSTATNRLYVPGPAGWPCVDVSEAMNVDTDTLAYTVAVADIDGDFDLDLLVQGGDDKLFLYVNHHQDAGHAVRLRVVGTGGNTAGLGAVIDARVGEVWQMREVIAGSNFKNQNELVQHIGLGDATAVDELVVDWPGGVSRTLTSLGAGRTWTLYPPERLGDSDGDGDRDQWDFTAFLACYDADAFEPGCEVMDFDGDADVDADDFAAFVDAYDAPDPDCNDNRQIDIVELFETPDTVDSNDNGVLDACEGDLGDLNGDRLVNADDVGSLLADWGPCSQCAADFNHDGRIDMFDLVIVLANFDD